MIKIVPLVRLVGTVPDSVPSEELKVIQGAVGSNVTDVMLSEEANRYSLS